METMPLNKQVALVGRFGGESKKYWAVKKVVAEINRRTIMYAQRFIYSARKDFIWIKKDREI